jgi:hypothetical protein
LTAYPFPCKLLSASGAWAPEKIPQVYTEADKAQEAMMGTYGLSGVLSAWKIGSLTTEQAVGQILQLLEELDSRVGVLERNPPTLAPLPPPTSIRRRRRRRASPE